MIINLEGSESCDLNKVASVIRNELVEKGTPAFVIRDVKFEYNSYGERVYSFETRGQTISSLTYDVTNPELYYGEGYVLIVIGGTATQAIASYMSDSDTISKEDKPEYVRAKEYIGKNILNTNWPVPDAVFNIKKYKGTLNILGKRDALLELCENAMSSIRKSNVDYRWHNVLMRTQKGLDLDEVETGRLIAHDILN
jgi:hypothetical protein